MEDKTRFRCKLSNTNLVAMKESPTNPPAVQFGLYELDLRARELRKAGVRIKLHEQPFQVLALLLERPGEVVTREELQARLWPSDTFVDFDLSLNGAVKKLRQALGDDSDNPRFVETLYRRGYRFIAPVSFKGAQTESSEVSLQQGDGARSESLADVVAGSTPSRKSSRLFGVGAAVIALLVAGAVAFVRFPKDSPHVVGFTQLTSGGRVHELTSMVTDGQRIYFQAAENDQLRLAEVSVSGGDSALLPTPFQNIFLEDIAPDGSSLLIADFEDTDPSKKHVVWLLPLPAGSPRPLESWGNTAFWWADGRHLLRGVGTDLYESNPDGSGRRKIATFPMQVSDARVSPDGKTIRVTISDPMTHSSELWETNRDGSSVHPLLPDWGSHEECCGRWTPDGKYYVFANFREGRNSLWILPERRWWFQPKPKPIQLTNGPLNFWDPLPSKDGKKIFAMGGLPRSEVLRYDGKSFVPYMDGMSASDLAFSADGKRVAYVSIPELTLWSSKVDGSDRIQLTPSGSETMLAGMPRWSPDGSQIVFMGKTANKDWRAYLVAADGQGMRELIPGQSAGFDPSWSPDGKQIVLALGDLGATSNKIGIFDLSTGKISYLPGGENFFGPRWSPDGRYIAAASTDSQRLMLYECATQKWTELAKIGVGYPSWSRDSQFLYLDAIFTDEPAFYRIRIADHKLERIASLKGVHRLWGVFAEWSGLTPDESPLVTRDIGSPEIYALDWRP